MCLLSSKMVWFSVVSCVLVMLMLLNFFLVLKLLSSDKSCAQMSSKSPHSAAGFVNECAVLCSHSLHLVTSLMLQTGRFSWTSPTHHTLVNNFQLQQEAPSMWTRPCQSGFLYLLVTQMPNSLWQRLLEQVKSSIEMYSNF